MSFTPKAWADGSGGNTPITALDLNRMERGIDQAFGQSAAVLTNATTNTETVVARHDFPADYLDVGDMINARLIGQVSGTATLTFRLRLGTAGTTADPLLIAFVATTAGVANAWCSTDCLIPILTSTTAVGGGTIRLGTSIVGPVTGAFAPATFNPSLANKLSVTVQQSAAQTFTTRAASLGWIG